MANESGSLIGEYSDLSGIPYNKFTSGNKIGVGLDGTDLNSFFKRQTIEPILEDPNDAKKPLPNRFPNKIQELPNSIKDKTSEAFSMDFFIIAIIFFVFICSLIGLVGKG